MAIYTLEIGEQELDENVRIKKVETKEVESFVSVADLKQRHSQLLEEIERIKVEADLIVDQITEIDLDEGIDLTIKEIPTKLIEKLIK
jgi:uncharacterized small protein (DUF1192 family)